MNKKFFFDDKPEQENSSESLSEAIKQFGDAKKEVEESAKQLEAQEREIYFDEMRKKMAAQRLEFVPDYTNQCIRLECVKIAVGIREGVMQKPEDILKRAKMLADWVISGKLENVQK